jgi:formyltetrahydrofolate deformylase
MATATLLITCPDRPGLVAAVAAFLAERDANIVHADQHVDRSGGLFVQRVEFTADGHDLEVLATEFGDVARHHDMTWDLHTSDVAPRVAILASREPHCLVDLLGRWDAGSLPGAPVLVISNHPDHAGIVGHYGIPYHHLPVVDAYPGRIINIHHSFLPAFAGGRPYHQAHDRGVKVIGATAHYVTADLDEGPIIDQDVTRVSHRDDVGDLIRKGQDLEKVVLARAVRLHLERRALIVGTKTVVFD